MTRMLYLSMLALVLFLVYTIYSYDLKVTDIREYDKKILIYSIEKCKFCSDAKELLDKKDIAYTEMDITWDKELRNKLEEETRRSTVPYIFINGKFIGGYSELADLEKNKKLLELLKE